MAREFETSDVTLYALLLRDHEQQWKDAQIARSLAKLESSKTDLDNAQDPLSLARAREHIRASQWELERLLNRIFGQKQEITHTVIPVFSVTLKDHTEDRANTIGSGMVLENTGLDAQDTTCSGSSMLSLSQEKMGGG